MLSESAALHELFGGAVIVCDLHNERGHVKTSSGETELVSRFTIEQLERRGDIKHEDNASVRVWKAAKRTIGR